MYVQMLRTLAIASLLSSAFAQYSSNETSSACPTGNGVHIIVARASTEALGYGVTGIIKDAVLSRVPGSTAEFVFYPATLSDYQNSETAGVAAMKELVANYIASCSGPYVLMGYSQGAQVTLDTIVGQEDKGFTDNSTVDQPLSDSTLSRLAAAVVFGDPTFTTDETFHVGNATKNGDFPRQDTSRFTPALSSKIHSYCDDNDLYCAGGTSIAVHVGYVQEYGTAAEDFVVAEINKYFGTNSTASASGAMSSTKKPASATASVCKSASKMSKASASASVSRGMASASASATPSSTPSSTMTASSSMPVSTGAASALSMDVLGMGAMLAFALFVQ